MLPKQLSTRGVKNFWKGGKKLFQNNEFDKSKIFFERDIVFNPKSEKSYLYLAKIFSNDDNDQEAEIILQCLRLHLKQIFERF